MKGSHIPLNTSSVKLSFPLQRERISLLFLVFIVVWLLCLSSFSGMCPLSPVYLDCPLLYYLLFSLTWDWSYHNITCGFQKKVEHVIFEATLNPSLFIEERWVNSHHCKMLNTVTMNPTQNRGTSSFYQIWHPPFRV
jgi:hypothetical protein